MLMTVYLSTGVSRRFGTFSCIIQPLLSPRASPGPCRTPSRGSDNIPDTPPAQRSLGSDAGSVSGVCLSMITHGPINRSWVCGTASQVEEGRGEAPLKCVRLSLA